MDKGVGGCGGARVSEWRVMKREEESKRLRGSGGKMTGKYRSVIEGVDYDIVGGGSSRAVGWGTT